MFACPSFGGEVCDVYVIAGAAGQLRLVCVVNTGKRFRLFIEKWRRYWKAFHLDGMLKSKSGIARWTTSGSMHCLNRLSYCLSWTGLLDAIDARLLEY